MVAVSSLPVTSANLNEKSTAAPQKLGIISLVFWPVQSYAVTTNSGPFTAGTYIHGRLKAGKPIRKPGIIPADSATKRKHHDGEPPIRRCTGSASEGPVHRPVKRAKLEEYSPESSATSSATSASGSLRCPLAITDPERDSACRRTMSSNGAIARHLFKHHRRAPYCPTCWTTFASDTERDSHVRLRDCQQAEARHIEGLSVKQLGRLVRYFDLEDDCERTWLQMLRLVAPN